MRSAALWSAVWISVGLLFGVWLSVRFGVDAGLVYLMAYLVEKSLSVDNLFVFILIFSSIGLPLSDGACSFIGMLTCRSAESTPAALSPVGDIDRVGRPFTPL